MRQSWVDEETAECDLGDARLNRRLGTMLEALGERPGKSLPTAFQDWSNTKAAYRFFANEDVSEDKILEGHFAASALRIQATDGPILILQDTTEFSFKRSAPEKIGFTKVSSGRKQKEGRHQKHAICGLLMHASLAITADGLPLGLTAAKFWSRDKFKGTTALKRKINPTRVPIEQKESMRWLDNLRRSSERTGVQERCVHIGDRESDIYELYCLAQDLGTRFLVRSCIDRLAEDGKTTIAQVMAAVQPSGTHEIQFRDAQGKDQHAVLSIKHATMTVRPPIGKQKKYRHHQLQVIHAQEIDPPRDRAPVFWKLITNLPRRNSRRRRAQARLVCAALEHRDLFQNTENRMPDRGYPAHHSRPPCQLYRALLRRGLENILADNAPPSVPKGITSSGLYRNRKNPSRPHNAQKTPERVARLGLLHDRGCPAGGLSRPRK